MMIMVIMRADDRERKGRGGVGTMSCAVCSQFRRPRQCNEIYSTVTFLVQVPIATGTLPCRLLACSPLDAGQTDVMIDTHDRPLADFRNKRLTAVCR